MQVTSHQHSRLDFTSCSSDSCGIYFEVTIRVECNLQKKLIFFSLSFVNFMLIRNHPHFLGRQTTNEGISPCYVNNWPFHGVFSNTDGGPEEVEWQLLKAAVRQHLHSVASFYQTSFKPVLWVCAPSVSRIVWKREQKELTSFKEPTSGKKHKRTHSSLKSKCQH